MGRQVKVMIMVMIISMRQKAMVVRGELEGWLYFEDIKGTHLRGSQVSKHLLLLVFYIWDAKSRILNRRWIMRTENIPHRRDWGLNRTKILKGGRFYFIAYHSAFNCANTHTF